MFYFQFHVTPSTPCALTIGKDSANREQNQIHLSYAEMQPIFAVLPQR